MENRASVEIIEQPAEKSFRFRYESEGRLTGSIVGENSTRTNPSYPTLRVKNYTGKIYIRITCVTRELNGRIPKQHPHKVSTDKDLRKSGEATLPHILDDSGEIQLKEIGIIYVKRQDIKESLTKRKEKNIDPTGGGWNHIEKKEHFDLHNVCLCFEVFKCSNNCQYDPIGYVISKPITDKKSNAALKIIEISSTTASVLGGDKIILLCDKVKREDISVVFYEKAENQEIVWRQEVNYKNSASMKVHHQYAISFQTPKYREFDIREPQKVFIQLYRPSDNERSEPIPFELLPNNAHSIQLRRKKQKKLNETVKETLSSSHATQLKKVYKPKFVPNIQVGNTKGVNGHALAGSNRNNPTERPANHPMLINLSEENKENVDMPMNNPVQNTYQQASIQQQYQRPMPIINPYDDQYNPCGTYSNSNSNSNFPSYYYTPMGQEQNVNGNFDEPSTGQAPQYTHSRPILLPNIYQHQQQQHHHYQNQHHHHQQQQQQQHNTQSNVFANGQHQNQGYLDRTTTKQPRNSHMNYMPLTYLNEMNKQATDYSIHGNQAMNITAEQSRLSELEQRLNKSDLYMGNVDMGNVENDPVAELSGEVGSISLNGS